MVKAAAAAGYLDERAAVLETLTVDPPRRRRHRHHLPREGRRPMASVTAQGPLAARTAPRSRSTTSTSALLNLMQGTLPDRAAALRARRRGAPRSPRSEVLARVQRAARRAHHPPGHADLRHARARLRLDARRRQGRPRAPVARGEDHQLAPRRHRTTTCATTTSTCGSRSPSSRTRSSGLEGTLDVLAASSPAPSRSASCRR